MHIPQATQQRKMREPVLGDGKYEFVVYFDPAKPERFVEDLRRFASRFVSHDRVNTLVGYANSDIQEIWQLLTHRMGVHIPKAPGSTYRTPVYMPTLGATASGDPVQIKINFTFGWDRHGHPYVRDVYFVSWDTEENRKRAADDVFWEKSNQRALERERNRRPSEQEQFMPDALWTGLPRAHFIGTGAWGRGGAGSVCLRNVLDTIYPIAAGVASRHQNHFLPGGSSSAQGKKVGFTVAQTASEIAFDAAISSEAPMGVVGRTLKTANTIGKDVSAVSVSLPLISAALDMKDGNYLGAGANVLTSVLTFASQGNPVVGLTSSMCAIFEEFIYLGESSKVMQARRKIYAPYALGFVNRFSHHKSWPTDPVARGLANEGYKLANQLNILEQIAVQLLLLYRVSRDSGWSFASNPAWTFPDAYKRNWAPDVLLHGLLNSFNDEPYCTK